MLPAVRRIDVRVEAAVPKETSAMLLSRIADVPTDTGPISASGRRRAAAPGTWRLFSTSAVFLIP